MVLFSLFVLFYLYLYFLIELVAYSEMPGEDEQMGKQQVVVHLTLKEYKVNQIKTLACYACKSYYFGWDIKSHNWCLPFCKKKKIPFSFKRFQRKYHSVVSKKKASNISEIKSGTLITWSITTGVWIIGSKLKLHWCHASCSHQSISGFLTCSITLLYDLFCRKLLKHSTLHSQWFHHAQGWTWPMRLVPVIMEMRVMMKEKRNTVSFLKWLVNDKVDQGSPPKKKSYLQLLINTEHEDNILFVFT